MAAGAFEAWIDEARAVPLVRYACEAQPKIRRHGGEYVGPCPGCGGTDRFSISIRKNVWHCRDARRRGDLDGGDVIALVQHAEGVDFVRACELLVGRPAPGREANESEAERAARLAAVQERRARAAAEAENRAKVEAQFREAEIKRARRIWERAAPLPGTPAAAYLERRGLVVQPGGHLRFAPDLPFFVIRKDPDGRHRPHEIHRGPAMVGGIIRPDGRFTGVHLTWIDLSAADGKARLADPDTGELQPAKKVRGSVHGARIELVRHPAPTQLFLGEGIETCLSAYLALLWRRSPVLDAAVAVWSAVSLGNLAGKAQGRVRHPSLRHEGSDRPVFVADATPDPADAVIPIPETVTELWLLGDGDSDRFTTDLALKRAAARFARPGLTIRCAWAEPGTDFNGMLRGAA